MSQLYDEGITVNGVTWKALLLTASMDLQARAYVLNMTHHNGKYGCLYCLEEGTAVSSGGGYCRSYPFRKDQLQLRTHQTIQESATIASVTGKPDHGICGKTVLSYLPSYSIEKNVIIDYMHGILLGITKKLMYLWFDSKNYRQSYFIGHQVNKVDRLLKTIKPPYLISRLPRKIKNNFHRWKASEFRSWLLHYSLPCLSGILPDLFLEHFSCLVEGIYLLLQGNISAADIERADMLLRSFYQHAGDIYGNNFLGLNVHNLIHYTACVKMWGPLWAYSCFGYESCNGDILKAVHGKGNVCAQIFWSMQAQKRLEKQAKTLPNGKLKSFLQKLLVGGARLLPQTLDGFNCKIVPPLQELSTLDNHVLSKLQELNKNTVEVKQLAKVHKVVKGEQIFYSQASSRVKRRNSHVVLLENELEPDINIMSVDYFLVEKQQLKVFAVGQTFLTLGPVIQGRVPHVQMIEKK